MRQCGQRWYRQMLRQALRFIEQHDSVAQVVQLAARRWPVGEQRFEQLHVGREDDRCIPVLRQRATLALGVFTSTAFGVGLALLHAQPGEAVMFEYVVLGFAGKHEPVLARGLLDDAQERNHEHDTLQLMAMGMGEREPQHRERLARTRGCGQREQSSGRLGS